MTDIAPRKFSFETVFDDEGRIAYAPPKQKRIFTLEEVTQIRAECYEDGQRSALVVAEQAAAAALQAIAHAAHGALSTLVQIAHDHRVGSAELSLACARQIADAALEQFPDAPAQAALEALAAEITTGPRLTVRASADLVERFQRTLDEQAQALGIPGQIIVKADPMMPQAAFHFDWGDGRASYDPTVTAERVAQALHNALIAEGLHAEAVDPHAHSSTINP
jgi:flagellar assembly protein FliH